MYSYQSTDHTGWLPKLDVVSCTNRMDISLSSFAPENLVSRDRFGRPALQQSAYSLHLG